MADGDFRKLNIFYGGPTSPHVRILNPLRQNSTLKGSPKGCGKALEVADGLLNLFSP